MVNINEIVHNFSVKLIILGLKIMPTSSKRRQIIDKLIEIE